MKLGNNEAVVDDCNSVLESEPANVKALFRRGQALVGRGHGLVWGLG